MRPFDKQNASQNPFSYDANVYNNARRVRNPDEKHARPY